MCFTVQMVQMRTCNELASEPEEARVFSSDFLLCLGVIIPDFTSDAQSREVDFPYLEEHWPNLLKCIIALLRFFVLHSYHSYLIIKIYFKLV